MGMPKKLSKLNISLGLLVPVVICITWVATNGCKPRRGASGLRAGSASDTAQDVALDMTRIEMAIIEAKSSGWPQLYIDPNKLRAGAEAAAIQAAKPTDEDGKGWPLTKQIKGIVALSDDGKAKLIAVKDIIEKRGADPNTRHVSRMGIYFISWLLREMGVQYEPDAIDENLRAYYRDCDSFSDCGKLLQDLSRFGDMAPGPTIRALVGDKGLAQWYGEQKPTGRMLFNPSMWTQLVQSGFPNATSVDPDSVYGKIFALQEPLLRDILVFHAHSLLLNTIFYGLITDADVTIDKARQSFVRQPSGRIPGLPDSDKAVIQARVSELKTLHSTMILMGGDPKAVDKDKEFVDRIKTEMLSICSDEFTKLPQAEGDLGAVRPVDVIESSAQDVRLGFIRALEGVLSVELYLRRVNLKDIRPWLDSLVASGTEVAALTLARNMKREASLPSAQFYNRTTAQVVALSPRIVIKDATDTPRQKIRDDYRAIAQAVDELAFMNRTSIFGAYGLDALANVEKDRVKKGGFMGALLDATVRPMGKEEAINGCRTLSNSEMTSTFFLRVGESYSKLSVDANARENADPEDPFTKTVSRFEIPRLLAYQQDLASRFPLFNSMVYQSNLYTRAALRFGFFQKELMKSEEEKQRVKAEQSTLAWIGEGLGDLVLQAGDGLTVIVSLPAYLLYGLAFDSSAIGDFYDPNWRGDFKEISKGFQAQSDAAMKDYMHQYLALHCYNFMTLGDDAFRNNPSVCGPNGKPFKLANVCFNLPKNFDTRNPPQEWANRWNRGAQAPNIERNIIKYVDQMEQADFQYQINTLIGNTVVQIPLMMVSGFVGSMIVKGVTGAIAARFIFPLVKFTDYLLRLPVNVGAHFANASINMASFAVVHKSLMYAYQMAFATVLAPDAEAEYRRARLAFYDPDKTFFENYGEELASGSFLFFIQPAIGKLTDKAIGRLLGIRSSEHFYNLGKGGVGAARYWDKARKVMFVAGTGTTDGIFFFSMPFIEARFFAWIEGKDPNEKLKLIGQDFSKEFGNSFATALAFRVHGNLGGHFNNGPNSHRVEMSMIKYLEGLKRFREVYDKAIAEPMVTGQRPDTAYVAELAKENRRMDAEEARLKQLLGKFLEQRYLETRKPETPAFDKAKAVEETLLELRNTGDHANPSMVAASAGSGQGPGEREGVPPPVDDR